MYRVMSLAIGVIFIGVGFTFALDAQFSNVGVVVFLVGVGCLLAICGLVLPEPYLVAFFTFCVAINIVAAAYALLSGAQLQP